MAKDAQDSLEGLGDSLYREFVTAKRHKNSLLIK